MKNLGDQRRGKLTSLFTSERRYSRSGSITTTVEKEDDMRNSRISNLPNYKRETLECRLDFVVVFQTIEIERLSVEIESLRVRLLDSERQIFNYKNYEVQIRQLTERCFDYENEKSRNEQDMARLMMALREAEEGCEESRERAAAYEDELREMEDQVFRFKEELIIERKQREQVEDFRLQLQSNLKQKEKAYSRQLRELEKSTQLKKTDLSKNEENLNNLLRKYQEEIKDLRKENANLRAFYDSIEQQSKDLEARYEDLQEELNRTADALREKEFQLETVEAEGRERLDSLQARYEEEFSEKCRQVEEGENEVTELRASIDRLEVEGQRYQACLNEYQQKKDKYEMFLNEAGDEIDRLNTIIKDKNKYLQAWQTRFKELEGKHSAIEQDLAKTQHKLASSQEEAAKLTYAIKAKNDQLDKLERQRENEMHQVRERLSEAEAARAQMATLRKEKEQEREEAKRRQLENVQLKEQLNRRVAESNKIFEDLHRFEAELKTCKASNFQMEGAVREREEEARRAVASLEAANTKCDKLQGERRGLQQEVVRMKGLEQRLRHEEGKKNEYLSEGRKLSTKVKELEKANQDKKLSLELLQQQLNKYTEYARQAEQKIAQLEEELEFLMQMKRELAALKEKSKVYEEQISKLSSALALRTQELAAFKEKIGQYDKYIRQFRTQEQRFKEELTNHQRTSVELKQLKAHCNQLEDEKMELESYLVKLESEKAESLKEVSNLEKVIAINSQELKRVEQHLAETKQELTSRKDNEKTLFAKIKEAEKKVRSSEGEVEKERGRLAKERAEVEKQFEKKSKQLEVALKSERQEKEKLLQARQRLIKEKQTSISLNNEKNQELKEALRRSQDEMEKIFRYSKELEKKIVGVEHELERLTAKDQQTTQELQIAIANNEKALHRSSEQDVTSRQQRERIAALNAQQEELTGEVAGLREQLRGKETDIGHLMDECRQYKEEMGLLYEEIKEHGEIHSEQIAEIIKVKFQSENILELYNALRVRLGNMEGVIMQLKTHLGQVLVGHRGLAQEKVELERRLVEFQEALMQQVEKFQEVQFRQSEEIIRLETLNKILQIEVGEYKERESVMFSMVKEASIIKERETKARLTQNSPNKSELALTPRTMKESTIGEINILSKKSRTTRMEEEELEEEGEGLRSETGAKGGNNRVYFENLVFKNI